MTTNASPKKADIRERFPVRIYSQKQLFDLAKDPNALFTVIDDTADVRGAEIVRACKEAESKYLSLCAEARSLRTQAAELPPRRAALEDVRRKVEVLQQGGHAETLNEYRARRRQDGAWTSIQKSVTDAVATVDSTATSLTVADLDTTGAATGDQAVAALSRAHEQTRSAVQELRTTVLEAVAKARKQLEGIESGADLASWHAAIAASEQQYKAVTEQLAQAGIANPDEYRDLLQQATSLEQEIASLQKLDGEAEDRETKAALELNRYRDLRSGLTKRRKLFAESSSNQLIQVEIRGYAERGEIETFLRETLAIARFDEDYRSVAARIASPPTAQAEWSFESLDAVVGELRAVLADPKKSWPTQDRRFESALRKLQPERLDRLALYLPDDAVDVSFCDPRDTSGQWKKLSHGSPGQQTAALLAFVLGYGDEPIILDQPEDDLDNTLIYELLVRRLRESKQARQIIVVTHNPNIVVHGDAEFIVSLDAVAGQTRTKFAGGLQEQKARDEICRVMEGGREVFDTRYRRIMHSGAKQHG